jgi:hypothetical protein
VICQKIRKVEFRHPVYVAGHERRVAEKGHKAGDVGGREACEDLVLGFSATGLKRIEILLASTPVEDSLRYQIAMRCKDSCQRRSTTGISKPSLYIPLGRPLVPEE